MNPITIGYIFYKLTHTLVIVRQAWTNGVNYNFFGGIAKTFVRELRSTHEYKKYKLKEMNKRIGVGVRSCHAKA